MLNTEIVLKRRLIFRDCQLLKVTEYVSQFRGSPVRLYRHAFSCSQYNGQIVYTGKRLDIQQGQTVHIKGTIKREEKLGINFLRISRVELLDKLAPVPLLEKA